MNAARRRREAVLLKAGSRARGDEAGALRHDEELFTGHGMAGSRLTGGHVGDDEAPDRYEGQIAIDFDNAHPPALVGVFLQGDESQTLARHR